MLSALARLVVLLCVPCLHKAHYVGDRLILLLQQKSYLLLQPFSYCTLPPDQVWRALIRFHYQVPPTDPRLLVAACQGHGAFLSND